MGGGGGEGHKPTVIIVTVKLYLTEACALGEWQTPLTHFC